MNGRNWAMNNESAISRSAACVLGRFPYNLFQGRRDGRVAEGGGLLNRCTVKSCTGGSNPPLSAIAWSSCSREARTGFVLELAENGLQQTAPTAIAWSSCSREARAGFVLELAENTILHCRTAFAFLHLFLRLWSSTFLANISDHFDIRHSDQPLFHHLVEMG